MRRKEIGEETQAGKSKEEKVTRKKKQERKHEKETTSKHYVSM